MKADCNPKSIETGETLIFRASIINWIACFNSDRYAINCRRNFHTSVGSELLILQYLCTSAEIHDATQVWR